MHLNSDVNIEVTSALENLNIGKPEGYREESSQEEALFDPPLYKQRYLTVAKLINENACTSVVDMGCAECKFLSLIKDLCPNVETLYGVDLDGDLLERKKLMFRPLACEYILRRKRPLNLKVFSGSIISSNYLFRDIDFFSCIEVIEHLEADILKQVPYAIFECLQPKIVAITTPNSEYNVLFENFSGFRHWDHKFEWTRQEFIEWCKDIENRFDYSFEISGIGEPPLEHIHVGCCSQMAVFRRNSSKVNALKQPEISNYRLICEYSYPYDDINENKNEKFVHEVEYILNHFYRVELREKLNEFNDSSIENRNDGVITQHIDIAELLCYPGLKKFNFEQANILSLLKENFELIQDDTILLCKTSVSELDSDSYYGSDMSETEELDSIYQNEIDCDGFDDEEDWE